MSWHRRFLYAIIFAMAISQEAVNNQQNQEPTPGLKLEPDLQHKLDGLDDHLQPLNADENKKDDKEKEENVEPDSTDSTENEDSEEADEGDDGYVIDEDGDNAPDKVIKEEQRQPENRNLTAEQQYVLDRLSPWTVKGTIPGSDDVKEFKVFTPEHLPTGFKYVDDREQSVANKAFTLLESKAQQLQTEFRNEEQLKTSNTFIENEKKADREEIGKLQRTNEIPKFPKGVDPDSPQFENHPAVKQVQEILDFKDKKNDEYFREYQAGRRYKHIGFEEAFRMFRKDSSPKVNEAQQKEDKERKDLARRTTSTTSTNANTLQKSRVHSNMSSRDLDNLLEDLTSNW